MRFMELYCPFSRRIDLKVSWILELCSKHRQPELQENCLFPSQRTGEMTLVCWRLWIFFFSPFISLSALLWSQAPDRELHWQQHRYLKPQEKPIFPARGTGKRPSYKGFSCRLSIRKLQLCRLHNGMGG